MAKDKSDAPPGAYVEVGVDEIDEGRFKKALAHALRKAWREFVSYEAETGDSKAKVVVTPKIVLQRMKGSEELIDISYQIAVKTPTATRASVAKERGGKMLAQPSGTNTGNPDQQLFYDARGNPIGVDTDTGEVQTDVVGRIARQA